MPKNVCPTGTVNSSDPDISALGAALADARHAKGLSKAYYREADETLKRVAARLEELSRSARSSRMTPEDWRDIANGREEADKRESYPDEETVGAWLKEAGADLSAGFIVDKAVDWTTDRWTRFVQRLMWDSIVCTGSEDNLVRAARGVVERWKAGGNVDAVMPALIGAFNNLRGPTEIMKAAETLRSEPPRDQGDLGRIGSALAEALGMKGTTMELVDFALKRMEQDAQSLDEINHKYQSLKEEMDRFIDKYRLGEVYVVVSDRGIKHNQGVYESREEAKRNARDGAWVETWLLNRLGDPEPTRLPEEHTNIMPGLAFLGPNAPKYNGPRFAIIERDLAHWSNTCETYKDANSSEESDHGYVYGFPLSELFPDLPLAHNTRFRIMAEVIDPGRECPAREWRGEKKCVLDGARLRRRGKSKPMTRKAGKAKRK